MGISEEELAEKGGMHTAREIVQQPDIWQKIWADMLVAGPDVVRFLNKALPVSTKIILTGAGTSAFIGLSLRSVFHRCTGMPVEAVATTDIVSHPGDYFKKEETILLVSFARSGDSPESVAALHLADTVCDTCFHLIITCNGQGELARFSSASAKQVIVLPPESNDRALAMTSSYTGMLLAGLLVARVKELSQLQQPIKVLIQYGRDFIAHDAERLRKVASMKFERAVFLGSGVFFGTATEANLKLQELTDGRVICKQDTYLGFRHGPKSVVNAQTLLVYLLSSSNAYAFKYEKDLIDSMGRGTQPMLQLSVSESEPGLNVSEMFYFSKTGKQLDDEWLLMCYILPAQILGFYKSLELGLRPDQPSSNNDISRVVEGVRIHVC